MCGRYRLTKRRMLEIQDYYGIDDIRELDLWQREFNIPLLKWPRALARRDEAALEDRSGAS